MSFGNIGNGIKKVASNGVAVQLIATNTPCKKVIVSALPSNAGVVVVGGAGVVATSGSETGIVFDKTTSQPNEPVVVEIEDVSKLYVNGPAAGDGVAFAYLY